VVSRVLRLFLRSEGYETARVPADLEEPAPGSTAMPEPWDAADLVILLPGLLAPTQAAVCQRVKRAPPGRQVPVLALLDLAANTAAPGVDATLAWPFRLKEVLTLVNDLLGPVGGGSVPGAGTVGGSVL